jgi:hypothetical protein
MGILIHVGPMQEAVEEQMPVTKTVSHTFFQFFKKYFSFGRYHTLLTPR